MSNETKLPWVSIDSFVGNQTDPSLTCHRPCPVCDSLRYRVLLEFKDFQFFSDAVESPKRTTVRNVQCLDCQAIYLNPCYSSVGFDYLFAEAGCSYGASEGRPLEQQSWLVARSLLNTGVNLLDIGCYDGRFLSQLPTNIRRIGVDIDAIAIANGLAQYGEADLELVHGAFESFTCPIQPDVITMFHVLEHLSNPLAVLRHLHNLSHADTKLVIEVPVIEFGNTNDINGFLSVQHMTHFSLNSLRQLLQRAGWLLLESQKIEGYNGYRVLVQPGEVRDAVLSNSGDLGLAHAYLAHWFTNLATVEKRIASCADVPRMVIWGGGMHSEFVYQITSLFRQNRKRQYIVVDSDPLKQGKSWRGLPIFSSKILSEMDWTECRLLVSSYGSQERMVTSALELGVPAEALVCLYDMIHVY
ncbi:class I SAM-dependent methyltransferase [Methylotuvimicrobium sp. KM2]|uniref:class I SAM-dependent methyltransferase n=1 Tax=Methylotuvimicrobium sp. KM2 TaxID=3133976 RepID=UPI0031017880